MDASVAAKWVIEEMYSDKAALLLECETLHAPDHWRAEASNVLWSKVYKGELNDFDAEERMRVLMRAPVVETRIATLMMRAFAISLAYAVTIYDSLYVALADARGIPFVTADKRLIDRISVGATSKNCIVWIGDLHPS